MFNKYSKTFKDIVLYISITMLITIIILSNVFYFTFEKRGLQVINGNNQKLLSQVSYNLTYINEINKNFCTTQFYDSDTQAVISSKDETDAYILNTTRMINKFQKDIVTNPMIDSIMIYNGAKDRYDATNGWQCKEDKDLVKIIQEGDKGPVLQVIPRLVYNSFSGKYDQKVFTYIMCDYIDYSKKKVESALAVNVKTDWLFQKLVPEKEEGSRLYLIDNRGKIILNENNEVDKFENITAEYLHRIQTDTSKVESLIVKKDNEKRVISYLKVPNTEWILINDQAYDVLFGIINEIRNTAVFITFVALVIAIVMSRLLANKIYKPIGILTRDIKDTFLINNNLPKIVDDTKYLSMVFKENMSRLRDLESYKKTTRDIIKENFLRNMLLDSSINLDQLDNENIEVLGSSFTRGAALVTILLKIDKYEQCYKDDADMRELLGFIISNIATEILTDYPLKEVITMGKEDFIFLIEQNEQIALIYEKLKEIQLNVFNIVKVKVSAFIHTTSFEKTSLNKGYRELQHLSRYRLIYGGECILNNEEIKKMVNTKVIPYPKKIEEKMMEELNNGDVNLVIKEFDNFIAEITPMNIDNFLLSLIKLGVALNVIVNKVNKNRVNKIPIDFNEFNESLMKCQLAEDAKTVFLKVFEIIIFKQTTKKEEKQEVIILAITDYIRAQYKDRALCLKLIAAEFNMSSVYLGMIFKEIMNKSVQEYINEIRLEHCKRLIITTDIPINEVIEDAGFESVSSFYRLYKKYYRTTPKEQRLTALLEEKIK